MAASSQSRAGDGGESRVQCLYCGANNFPASPTCWQCGRPLQALHAGSRGVPPDQNTGRQAPALPRMGSRASAEEAVSPTLAPKAAAALGLMFPFIALPVGMVFLMLDDARKTQIGWIMIGWSIGGSVISALFLLATAGPTLALLKGMIPNAVHGAVPGLPSPTGDPGDLNIILSCLGRSLQESAQASWLRLGFVAPCNRV